MANCQVIVQTAPGAPIHDAWVYTRSGGNVTVVRSNADGRLMALRAGGDATRPWDYTAPFTLTVPSQVDFYYTLGTRPILNAVLSANGTIFVTRALALPNPPQPAAQPNPVPAGQQAAVVVAPAVTVTLPAIQLTLTFPVELTLWPLLFELATDVYHTDGLNQGAALWAASPPPAHGEHLTETEDVAPRVAASAAARPSERGLRVAGTIDVGASAVRIQLYDASGNQIQLRANATSNAGVAEIRVDLSTVAGSPKPFSATLYFLRTTDAMGPVQIVVLSDGMATPIVGGFACQIVGVQAALVDDRVANPNGQQRGGVLGEADERVVIDFLTSPVHQAGATAAQLQALLAQQTRARRMVPYQIACPAPRRPLPGAAAGAANVTLPEMPLWMAELQILGLNRPQLEDLMVRRKHQVTGAPTTLRLAISWKLNLYWDGPDSAAPGGNAHTVSNFNFDRVSTAAGFQPLSGQTLTFTIDATDHLVADAAGNVGVFAPAPVALTFPIAGRRTPTALVSAAGGTTRDWGRTAAAVNKDAVVIEWQAPIVDGAGNEIIRGGGGTLTVEQLTIDGARIDGGMSVSGGGAPAAPPAAQPDLRPPKFRVWGANPAAADGDALVNAVVEQFYNAHNGLPQITILSLACWQQTMRLVTVRESGRRQFLPFATGSGRYVFGNQCHGWEAGMPFFGAPHGYGYGQQDPTASYEDIWSVIGNIQASVVELMQDKANPAWAHFAPHALNPAVQRDRAIFQRDVVRRYNGGLEFVWHAGAWMIDPSVRKAIAYCNNVFRPAGTTAVVYGAAGAPVAFNAANYGPGT